MQLKDFFKDIYMPRRLAGMSDNTIRLYRVALKHFDHYLGRLAKLDDFCDDTLSGFAQWRRKDVSPATVNKDLFSLLAMWRFACKKHYLAEWPDVRSVPEYQRVPTVWLPSQIGQIIEACFELGTNPAAYRQRAALKKFMPTGMAPGLYFAALVLFIYDTGLRINAVLNIRKSNVDLEQRTVYVSAETQKDKQDQLLKFSEQTKRLLLEMQKPERELFFPWIANKATLYLWYSRILKRAGLSAGRRDKFQRIRRTTATLCKAGGADATEQLGHSSDATTRKHYLSPTAELQAADVLPRPLLTV